MQQIPLGTDTTTRLGKYLLLETIVTPGEYVPGAWRILSREKRELGRVAWYGRWKQYVFAPEDATIFNIGCLKDLTDFLGEMNTLEGRHT